MKKFFKGVLSVILISTTLNNLAFAGYTKKRNVSGEAVDSTKKNRSVPKNKKIAWKLGPKKIIGGTAAFAIFLAFLLSRNNGKDVDQTQASDLDEETVDKKSENSESAERSKSLANKNTVQKWIVELKKQIQKKLIFVRTPVSKKLKN